MWREYVRMEMGFVEGMRRRWGVLGIDLNGKGKAKAQENVEDGMDDTEVEQMQGEAEGEGDEAEKARREIMQGAIVKSVISNAVKGASRCFQFLGSYSQYSNCSITKGRTLYFTTWITDDISCTSAIPCGTLGSPAHSSAADTAD